MIWIIHLYRKPFFFKLCAYVNKVCIFYKHDSLLCFVKSALLCFIFCFLFLLFSSCEIKGFFSSTNLYIEIAGLQNKTPWHSLFYSCCPHNFQLSVNCTAPLGNLVVHRAYTVIFACLDVPGYSFSILEAGASPTWLTSIICYNPSARHE